MSLKLDLLDLKIIRELQQDSRISITELSQRVSASRPTVSSRLKRLRDEKIALINGGLNINKFGFKIVCVGLEVKNNESRIKVEGYLKACPRVLNIFRTPGKANLHLSVWGENDQTLNSTIESFRDFPDVEIVYTYYVGTPIHGNIAIPITVDLENKTPCDADCEKCYRYTNDRCLGCPSTAYYKNPLIK
jgi:Lrp/AsnC family leucine-responsive transcriptional regulator